MDVTFANAGAFECLLIGSLIVLIGIALPGVRKHLLKTSAGFDGAPIYTLINYSAACVLTLSLPIFLSHSSNPIEFILNAVASTLWERPRMRGRRLRRSSTDPRRPPGDLGTTN